MKLLTHAAAMTRTLARHAPLLASITRVELRKRYAGSVLGIAWLVLQPTLLLSVYLFVYLVVFNVRFPGFSEMDFVLFVFAGLVPFLGAIEAINGSALSIKANMHLVKNVMLPIDLVPVRTVLVAMSGEMVALVLVTALSGFNGSLGPWLALLPVAVLLQVMALLGFAWIIAGIGVALPDVSYFTSLLMFLLMFISPVAFKPEMVPPAFQAVIYANPVFYLLEVFRDCLIDGRQPDARIWAAQAVISLTAFVAGAAFFRSFKSVLIDSE
jgi:lipopolysaccharide transport system permease protein